MKIPFNPSKPVATQYVNLSPVILVTTVNSRGIPNVAPKTQATPIGRKGEFFMFACTPEHNTYHNIKATKEFVVNFPTQEIIAEVGMAASVFDDKDKDKISLLGLTSIPSLKVRPPRISECSIHLECELMEIRDYSEYGLIVGKVVAASGNEEIVLQQGTTTDLVSQNLSKNPLLVYITPGQHLATIANCKKFPLPEKYKS